MKSLYIPVAIFTFVVLAGCNKGAEASTAAPTDTASATKPADTKKAAAAASPSDFSVPAGSAGGPNFGSKGGG